MTAKDMPLPAPYILTRRECESGDGEDVFTTEQILAFAEEYAKARCAELEADAARYRWLRDERNPIERCFAGAVEDCEMVRLKSFFSEAGLDAVIDAALAASEKQT